MHDSRELLEELRKRGYEARPDETGVVTVLVDPEKESAEEVSRIIKDVLGWTRSYGIKYKSRPPEWDREPKAQARDEHAAKTQRRKKPRAAAVDNDQLPGQMDIFDYLQGERMTQ